MDDETQAPTDNPESYPLQRSVVHSWDKAREIVLKFERESLWDAIQAREVPHEVVNYVVEEIKKGTDYRKIRQNLCIATNVDKSWRKIMAAIRSGIRFDGPAFLLQKSYEYQKLSTDLLKKINEAMEHGIERVSPTGEIVVVKGISQEISGAIAAYNSLNQGFVKVGKELGAFIDGSDPRGATGGQGVTIVVQSNIKLPSQEEIDQRRADKLKPDIEVASGPPQPKN